MAYANLATPAGSLPPQHQTPWLPPWVMQQPSPQGLMPSAPTQFQWQATHPSTNGAYVTSWGGFALTPNARTQGEPSTTSSSLLPPCSEHTPSRPPSPVAAEATTAAPTTTSTPANHNGNRGVPTVPTVPPSPSQPTTTTATPQPGLPKKPKEPGFCTANPPSCTPPFRTVGPKLGRPATVGHHTGVCS